MKHVKLINRSIAIALACTLASLGSIQATTQSSQQTQGTSGSNPQSKLIAPCIAAGIIIGIGAGGIYIIYRLCQHLPPPNPPPQPPPPVPPTPPTRTNAPPTRIGAAIQSLPNLQPPVMYGIVSPQDLTPPTPPGSTNRPSGSTNMPTANTPYYWVPWSWANANLAITNSSNDASLYDIGTLGYVDTNGPSAAPCLFYVTGTVSNLQSSTDLITWSNYTFNAWISTNGATTVLYDGSGIPVITNYGSGNLTGSTNTVPFGIWVSNEPKKFFRIVQTQ